MVVTVVLGKMVEEMEVEAMAVVAEVMEVMVVIGKVAVTKVEVLVKMVERWQTVER